MRKSLFIFRRDLRIKNNIGLYYACKEYDIVYCIFIFDDRQQKKQNKYFSDNAFSFMIESLEDLMTHIPLNIYYGNVIKIISKIIRANDIDAIIVNEDYTPFSIMRDTEIKNAFPDIIFQSYDDVCLNSPKTLKPYKIFSPYYKIARKIKVDKNKYNANIDKIRIIPNSHKSHLPVPNNNQLRQRGGRTLGKRLLNNVNNIHYELRDNLMHETSRLSPHLKFGTISVREVYHKAKKEKFIRQLYWRDFYMQIVYYFPHVLSGQNFHNPSSNKRKWSNNMNNFKKWCNGDTNEPLIDAAMNQLNTTGYMHNRCRMIVVSYLTHHYNIHWKYGEQYFATQLTDYDPANNNGGWQWSAGTGCDPQAWKHIFNPARQQTKYDKNNLYLLRYNKKIQWR